MKLIKCGAMPHPGFRVKRAVRVRLRRYDNGWLVESMWLQEWGWGKSQSDAMIDLMRSLAYLYEAYSKGGFGPHLTRNFERLKTYIEPRR